MQLEKIEALIALFRDPSVGELALREGESTIRLVRFNHAATGDCASHVGTPTPRPISDEAAKAAPTAPHEAASPLGSTPAAQPTADLMQSARTAAPSTAVTTSPAETEITSPMFGVVHLTPSPSDAAFVALGDSVVVGTPLCTVEAMKTFNTVEAEVAGVITAILVKSGDEVRPGRTLFKIAS